LAAMDTVVAMGEGGSGLSVFALVCTTALAAAVVALGLEHALEGVLTSSSSSFSSSSSYSLSG
jgi:hypothetical protein